MTPGQAALLAGATVPASGSIELFPHMGVSRVLVGLPILVWNVNELEYFSLDESRAIIRVRTSQCCVLKRDAQFYAPT